MSEIINEEPNKQFKKRGLHNWRNLFKKPNGYEWTILIMLIFGGLMTLAWDRDTKVCKDFVRDLPVIACSICNQKIQSVQNYSNLTSAVQNFSQITQTNDTYTPPNVFGN